MKTSKSGFKRQRTMVRKREKGVNKTMMATTETYFDGDKMHTTYYANTKVRNPYS